VRRLSPEKVDKGGRELLHWEERCTHGKDRVRSSDTGPRTTRKRLSKNHAASLNWEDQRGLGQDDVAGEQGSKKTGPGSSKLNHQVGNWVRVGAVEPYHRGGAYSLKCGYGG